MTFDTDEAVWNALTDIRSQVHGLRDEAFTKAHSCHVAMDWDEKAKFDAQGMAFSRVISLIDDTRSRLQPI